MNDLVNQQVSLKNNLPAILFQIFQILKLIELFIDIQILA